MLIGEVESVSTGNEVAAEAWVFRLVEDAGLGPGSSMLEVESSIWKISNVDPSKNHAHWAVVFKKLLVCASAM